MTMIPYYAASQKRGRVTKIQLLYIAWMKFKLGELDFIDFKDKVRAVMDLSDWVTFYEVPAKALQRFNQYGIHDPEHNKEFLRHYHEGRLQNIHKYGVNDFMTMPKNKNNEEK